MRKELATVITCLLVGMTNSSHADERFMFPLVSESQTAIKDMVKEAREDGRVVYHSLLYVSGIEIFVVTHNSGSGMPDIDTYAYACKKGKCRMFAMRNSGQNVLTPRMSLEEETLLLESEQGKVFLQVPLK